MTDPLADLDGDPALAAAVLEIEGHTAEGGWDQPARLYALVDTAQLVAREPALASLMGLDHSSAQGSLTPVEQDALAPDRPLEQALEQITWPGEVTGCAATARTPDAGTGGSASGRRSACVSLRCAAGQTRNSMPSARRSMRPGSQVCLRAQLQPSPRAPRRPASPMASTPYA